MPRQPINIIFIEKIADILINNKKKKAPEIFNELKNWSLTKAAEVSSENPDYTNNNKITQNIYNNYPTFRTTREYIRKIKTENLIPNIEEREKFEWPTSINKFSHIIPWDQSRNALDCAMWYVKKFSCAPSIGIVKWYLRISYATDIWNDIEQKCLKAEIFWCAEILNGYSTTKNYYNTLYEELQLQFKTWEMRGEELETSGFNDLANKFNAKPWINQIDPQYRKFFFEIMPHFKWFYDQKREYSPQPFTNSKSTHKNYTDMISKLNSIESLIKQINPEKPGISVEKQSTINSWKLNV